MAATSTQQSRTGTVPEKHIHHGRTTAAWFGTILTSVAFVVGAIGLVAAIWPIFWAGVAIVAVALIGTVVLRKMGHGAN